MRRLWRGSAVALCAALVAGCAPTAVLKGARDAFQSAKGAGAKDKAPYEYYSAKVYLELADTANKDKAYGSAKEYALKSADLSKQAFEKSGGGVK